jgi:hypothetical protein
LKIGINLNSEEEKKKEELRRKKLRGEKEY